MLKVHSQERLRPRRNVNFRRAIGNYLNRIQHRDLVYPEEWGEIQTSQGRAWLLEVWGDFLNRVGIQDVAPFQLNCFETLLDSSLLADGNPDPVMITAGTGFGKTEAFLFPILFYSTINLLRKRARAYGPDALLLYPRIDLCNNQLERYLFYAHCLKESVNASSKTVQILPYPSQEYMFRVALGHSGTNEDGHDDPFKVECPICKVAEQDGVIKLRRPPGSQSLTPFCSTDGCDDKIKNYLLPELKKHNPGQFTVSISTIDTLHNRLMDLHGRSTLWKKPTHLPRFIVLDEIHIYEGQAGSHISNLARRLKVYLKNIKDKNGNVTENKTPPIFVGASATVGNPAEVGSDIFGVPRRKIEERVLKPSDEESEPLGREYCYLLKTPPVRETEDNNNGQVRTRVVSEQASLYQALMAFWHAMRKTGGDSPKFRLLTFVDSIDSVWRITKNLADAEFNPDKQLFQFRTPRGRWDNTVTIEGNRNCPKFIQRETCEAPPHQFFERCGIYQQGECWWTMRNSPDSYMRSMRVVGRTSGFTAKPRGLQPDYDIGDWDCMVATSTLEVGFDHSELIATAQFKAPPNPASFQQRKGRGGRGIADIPLTLMVLGNSPGDLFAFKHEQRYFSPTEEDLKIQFDAKNQFIRNQHALSAIYDFLGWHGITEQSEGIHKNCDLHSALGKLGQQHYREALNNWMAELYATNDDLKPEDCMKLVTNCLEQLKQAIVPVHGLPGGIQNSLDLFQREFIPPDWRINLQTRIRSGGANDGEKQTLPILEAAEKWVKRFEGKSYKYLHPANYLNSLPLDIRGQSRNPSWVIPSTFIPEPLGGTIAVEGTGRQQINETESKLQALASFLPGGFKNRWRFQLWYGEWNEANGRPRWADMSDFARNSEVISTLEQGLSGRPIPPALRGFDLKSTYLCNPRSLRVQSGPDHFTLTTDGSRIKTPNDPPGGIRLSREPSASAQTYDLIVRNEENTTADIDIDGDDLGVNSLQFGENDLFRLFYSNLVSCYPQASRNSQAPPPLSINLKFYDQDNDRPIIPTVRLRTQGITLKGEITAEEIQSKMDHCKETLTFEEHYWRLVYRYIWRKEFLDKNGTQGQGIDFSFDCIKTLKALQFMDYRTRLTHQDSPLEELSETEIISVFQECRALCKEMGLDLFDSAADGNIVPHWNRWRDEILVPARNNMRGEIVDSFTQSLAMAICRDVADKTNTNLDLIKVSSESYQQNQNDPYSFYACIYDNIEGGNGTTSSYIDRPSRQMSLEDICSNQKQCDTSKDEKSILKLLLDRSYTADTLYSLARNPQSLRDKGFSDQALFKLGRLAASPSITAFYQGVGESYNNLKKILKREPGEEALACYLDERPIADPRGKQLYEQFKIPRGGISELIPRIAEVLPLCLGSCPDCLGDSRLSFEKGETIISDRTLI
ncbi:DEAD/DEAH box helicase [Verrucomicrobia bacterium]|nr:DEAD/DEAH box helicase [Verrucomicrobiota bacterium]